MMRRYIVATADGVNHNYCDFWPTRPGCAVAAFGAGRTLGGELQQIWEWPNRAFPVILAQLKGGCRFRSAAR